AFLDRIPQIDRFAGCNRAVIEVLPRAKSAAHAGQNDHPRVTEIAQRISKLGMHAPREAVQPIRAIERDPGDAVGAGKEDGFVGHCRCLAFVAIDREWSWLTAFSPQAFSRACWIQLWAKCDDRSA